MFNISTTTCFILIFNRPSNKEELFNLCHASARNVIERIFGVLKHRFRILLFCPTFSLNVQAQIPAALCSIHNFILHHDPNEGPLPDARDAHTVDDENNGEEASDVSTQVEEDERHAQWNFNEAKALRDHIAQTMWDSYQGILREREVDGMDDTLSDIEDIEDLLTDDPDDSEGEEDSS